MSNSRSDTGASPAVHLPQDNSPRSRIRRYIDRIADCLKRAIDGMARDDETRIDWVYVAFQLAGADSFLDGARKVAVLKATEAEDKKDDDDDGRDTGEFAIPDVVLALDRKEGGAS